MKRAATLAIFLGIAFAGGVHAQTLEEQLRSQLAEARNQLQDLQGQQAQWQAEKAKLEQDRDAARKEVDTAKAEASKHQGMTSQDKAALASERAGREQAEAQMQQLQKELADAKAKEHAQEQHGSDLGGQLSAAQQQVTTCTAKNQQLYQIGSEILDAYSHMSLGKMIAGREPFAASERVKLDNAAQTYGDRLYEQRYDPRATPAKKP